MACDEHLTLSVEISDGILYKKSWKLLDNTYKYYDFLARGKVVLVLYWLTLMMLELSLEWSGVKFYPILMESFLWFSLLCTFYHSLQTIYF